MKYNIVISAKAEEHIRKLEKSGDRSSLKRLVIFLEELEIHPRTGTGRPELLRHFTQPTFSRRISSKHRLVYEIHDDMVVVILLAAWGHYDDN